MAISKLSIAGVLAALALASPAAATQVFATSYDTPNGDGQAHSGSFNYWDLNYTGSGMTNVDGAALTGGVGTPDQILVDGVSQAFTGPANGTIGSVTLGGLNLTGDHHTIQFFQNTTFVWTFVSEVTFDGTAAIPEPATWAMMIGGFALAGAAMRRRKVAVSFA